MDIEIFALFFEPRKTKAWKQRHFVGNKTAIVLHVLKMQ
jgi:hypothetical protein